MRRHKGEEQERKQRRDTVRQSPHNTYIKRFDTRAIQGVCILREAPHTHRPPSHTLATYPSHIRPVTLFESDLSGCHIRNWIWVRITNSLNIPESNATVNVQSAKTGENLVPTLAGHTKQGRNQAEGDQWDYLAADCNALSGLTYRSVITIKIILEIYNLSTFLENPLFHRPGCRPRV